MSLKIPTGASLQYLDNLIADLLDTAIVRVFKNDYTPVDGSVLGSFTEANFTGYAQINMSGWSAAALDGNGKAATTADQVTWTMGTPGTTNTVYGIYVVTAAGALLYAERNPSGGILLNTLGQTFSYLPKFTFDSEA
jgi:hypothetical protein